MKTKNILYCILLAIIMIIFPVLSGVLISILTQITKEDYQIAGLFIQGIFILIAFLIAIIIMKKNKINFKDIDITFNINKKLIYFLPSVLIFIPMMFSSFLWKGIGYFIGCFFLYLMVGITEEVYFRGLIPNHLSKSFNITNIIIISTLIFGFGHSSIIFSGATLVIVILTIINALIFGFLMIELRVLTNNISLIMIIHFLFDFQSKFIIQDNIFIFEIIRGAIMTIYAIFLFIKIKKAKISVL